MEARKMKKIAEQLVERCEKVNGSISEGMGSSDHCRVKLEDGHCISVHVNCDIYKGDYPHDRNHVDDVDKQAMIKEMIKADIEAFNKAISAKLKQIAKL